MSDVRTNSSSYNNTRQQGRLTDPIDSMDGNNKTAGLQHCEVRSSEDPMLSLNGEVSLTNGYSSKAAADNDGSGSESGYTTPRKRRARRSSMKGAENVSRDKERSLQRGIMSYSKQDLETSGQEAAEKMVNSRPNCTRTCLKTEVHTGVRRAGIQEMTPMDEVQCKNSDGRPSGPISKKTDDKVSKTKLTSSVTSKEDLWTLFKPPPVFPVDNSSAKIVPKISYASKVKENLNKALSQVPMSAVKMVTSAIPEPRKSTLGDIFHNQWGLSFINEPNAGPEGTSSSRPTVSVIEVGDITFQGGSLPFFLQPGLDPACAVFLPPPQEVEKRTSGTDADLKACSPSRTLPIFILLLDPKRVVYYEEAMDGPDH
uniref:Uncharacterized protein n=1 Tax=Astyanax mexicanus TaxID=7994 RepID=A0A3B1J968_ASTMX